MTACRYEISILVFKNLHSFAAFTRDSVLRISARPCNILYMYIFTVPDRQTFMAYKPPKKIAFQTEISGKKFSRIFFCFIFFLL